MFFKQQPVVVYILTSMIEYVTAPVSYLFDLSLYVPSTINVKQGRIFMGWTSTKL